MPHFIVTGGCGFLGTWIVRQLLDAGDKVTVFDLQKITKRWEMILSPAEIERVNFRAVRIDDTAEVLNAFSEAHPDAVIHLAGLQVPACKADPVLGAKVNVIGTLNIFEAAKARLKSSPNAKPMSICYASSAAVFGPDAEYPEGPVGDQSMPRPANHYGAYKLCNEHTAKAYWLTDKISSVGLRPLTIYGPGRDFGMTSYPTRAIAAALLKRKYEIPFKGLTTYLHAREAADMFVRCARDTAHEGARVYTVGGDITDTAGFLEALEKSLPGARALITATGGNLPVAARMDDAALRRDFPGLLRIPLEQGLAETVAIFKKLGAEGKLEACLG